MLDLRDLNASDAKAAAKRLSAALKEKKIDLSHGECLDILARQFGREDWNAMAAQLGAKHLTPSKIDVPEGWYLSGRSNYGYIGGIDKLETHQGQPVFFLRNDKVDFATAALGQYVAAEQYRGKRVRYSAWLRCENVDRSASIQLSVLDDRDFAISMRGIETLRARGVLKATTGWSHRDIVLDVPEAAHTLQFGFYLSGTGEARFSGLDLEVVGDHIPETLPRAHATPQNLRFTR